MKTFLKCILPAAALLALACTGEEKQTGKPFEELPTVQEDQMWSFFAALPQADFPDKIKTPEDRNLFRQQFKEMEDGVLGDGEGYSEAWYSSENNIYWSDYFTLPEDYDWSEEPEDATHPYASLFVYMNPDGTRLYGILDTGAYTSEDEKRNPQKYYWYDIASGKVSEAKFLVDKPYTEEDLGENTLLHYGSNALYYSLKNGKYRNYFYDRGFEVYIEDVGDSGLRYEWDGTRFSKIDRKHIFALYNYGFSNIQLRESMPFDIPGYQTVSVETDNPYERVYELRKDGESTPTLVFHTSQGLELIDIEVCTDLYANIYGIYAGMPYDEFRETVDDYSSWFEDTPYVSIVDDMDEDYVYIFCGFDDDFYYMVDKKYYKGNNLFTPNAKIARIGVTSAVG